jgi:Tfp pilus assembly protein PilF
MTSEKIIDAFKEDFPLLIEAGFVAVKQLDETSATRIFHAAQAMSATSTAPQIGLGYIALNKLEVKEATRVFEEVLKKEPENYLAQTFLGICFLLTKQKRKKGEKLILEAMEKSGTPAIKNLGAISLEWAERDLKKKEAPFFAAKSSAGTGGEEPAE